MTDFNCSSDKKNRKDPLCGLRIAWLGSSVTYGECADGYSMADAIRDRHEGTSCFKYAVSGTTLADAAEAPDSSYISRLERVDPREVFDLFIVQLSTNDALTGVPLGKITPEEERENFDRTTVTGAMEAIISHIRKVWNCPILFYTGTKFDAPEYGAMVESLYALQKKWGFGILDLWNSKEMNAVSEEDYAKYMHDPIHPLREGYVTWWTPVFEEAIPAFLAESRTKGQETG